ncbi:28 kDa ribonucleoprotein, chloroplastic [Hordeum vulgare]|nr:28 kDa ribonucleoprotein, chloroplastic [Hordeum vulgare]
MSVPPRWADLPPELLAVVSGRLHDAADFARFHAVCTRWRDSLPQTAALRPAFFPWLIAPPSGYGSLSVNLRCVFSKTSYIALAPAPTTFSNRRFVARADGSAAWFFTVGSRPTLVDPLAGWVTALPSFPEDDEKTTRRMETSRGIIYGDGTVFLYNLSYSDYEEDDDEAEQKIDACFNTAILAPGSSAWKFVHRSLEEVYIRGEVREYEIYDNCFLAAYRVDERKTLLCVDGDDDNDTWAWYFFPALGTSAETDVTYLKEEVDATGWYIESSHNLESRGELLRVTVVVQQDRDFIYQGAAAQASALVVWVHAWEEEEDADGGRRLRWVRRDGRSFADRVMFLGFPTSFAVEAARFRGGEDDVSGGCVYLLQHRWSELHRLTSHGVFRYSLLDDKAKFIERLRPDPDYWSDQKSKACLWFMPQPSIAPIQVLTKALFVS